MTAESPVKTLHLLGQSPLVNEQGFVVFHDDLAVHHHHVDAAAICIVDQIVHRIEKRLLLGPAGVEQH